VSAPAAGGEAGPRTVELERELLVTKEYPQNADRRWYLLRVSPTPELFALFEEVVTSGKPFRDAAELQPRRLAGRAS
jgi:hypothetical protein